MKKLLFILLAISISFPLMAKKKDKKKKDKAVYEFTMVKDIPTSPVKNQYRSGTCWSFGGTAFLETELIRSGKGIVDLSEMYAVRHAYSDKAIRTVRWHGNLNFGGGGNFHDVLWTFDNFGAITEEAYAGLEYGEEKHVHGEMDALLKSYVNTVLHNKNRELSPAWHQGFDGILDAYLGEVPEKFELEGVEYTPLSYAKSLALNMDDYIEITSYNHHAFYETFVLEIPDNWMMASYYNVPFNEFMAIIENAITTGYSVGWDADVSEKGFSRKKGIAIIPNDEKPEIDGMESEKWDALDKKEKDDKLYSFEEIVAEKEITQTLRQEHYDNYNTTDDHLMLLTGIAKDQKGNKYFKVKNSWSEKSGPYDGFFYASEAFVGLKTVSILIHKDALTDEMKEKLGL
ncbi:MAG: aminopeptidase [Bacteroidales bacterium]|nr:aminopeptidase [Bacteroidales bacterium]